MASIVSIQNSLAAGELSPSLYGRTDLEKWHSGTATCRNFFVNYRGGINSRGGLAYVGTCKQPGTAAPPRDIPFQFSVTQGYALEFGDQYMRIKTNGAYVTEATKAITGITQANPAVFTSTSHGYSVGDWVFISGVTGMTNFNGLTWIINTVPNANTFTVTDLFGNTIDSTLFTGYSSGGTAARIYTVVAPYAAVDLPFLKYTQSADTMTLCLVNPNTLTEYPPYNLVRHAQTNWTFTQETFGAAISPPTGVAITATSSSVLSTFYSYVVTAISAKTGEESIASLAASVQNNDIAIYAGTNTITWQAVPGASSYNVYASTPSYNQTVPASILFGFIGTALGEAFVDTNIQPDFTVVPPVHTSPFDRGQIIDVVPTASGTNNYSQSTVGYSVTTSTGSGFVGLPIIANRQFAGMVIQNNGFGYQTGDTITITDSGGGQASGNYTFVGNITATPQTFTINGTQFFIHSQNDTDTLSSHDVLAGNTLALTLSSLAQILNASTHPNIKIATYTSDATHLFITYNTPGAVGNAFTLTSGSGGGSTWTASGATLTGGGVAGTGATATLTIGPQTGTYPSVPAYYQQRRVYANSINQPDTYWMSQPGLFTNMDSSIPVTASDAIIGTPWATQVNGIQFLVPMPGGLVVLTGKQAWQLNGGSQAALTPSDQVATPQSYNGVHSNVQPIVVNYDILNVQAKGSIVRDLSYNFFVNIYTGTDMTVLSNHLFFGHQIQQWAYAEEPYKLIWAIRDDGILLCFTYLKEQDVYAWTRHDTDGLFVSSVASITEPFTTLTNGQTTTSFTDAVYFIVQRYVRGQWKYYSERMDNRVWPNVEASFCVDSGLSYPKTFPNVTLNPAASTGTGVLFNATGAFTGSMVGNIIRVGGGIATITGYNNANQVVCTITQPITQVLTDDPNSLPTPAPAGTWSISVPTSTVGGLNHLEGMTVAIVADGSVVPNQVVTNGQVTLPNSASNIVVGLPFVCQAQTLYMDHPVPGGGTIQNRRKTITAVGVRVEQTRGLTVGADQPDASSQQNYATLPWTNMNEIKERTNSVFAGNAVPLYTGDHYKTVVAGWTVTGQIAIQQAYPLPASVLALVAYWESGDDK